MSTSNQFRLIFAWMLLTGIPAMARADDPAKAEKPPEAKKSTAFDPVEIQIHPSPAPVPALKYRLLPLEPDRTPGDAAPIYIRITVEMINADEVRQKVRGWLQLPRDRFPLNEARTLIDQQSRRLNQIAFGARRQACNWNYTLPEQREDSIEIMLPDAQAMRKWSWVLQLKARVEISDKKYDDAVRTLETGIAFGRHVGEGPFLINTLIGIAVVTEALAEVEELIAQPDAPNLYWALSALPQPLVPTRKAMEVEQELIERLVPEITDLNRRRTEGEWTALLDRLLARLLKLQKNYVTKDGPSSPIGDDTTLPQFRTGNLADAKAYYKSLRRSTAGMSDDEILVRSIADQYSELRDNWFKLSYVSYPEMARFDAPGTETIKTGPAALFAALMPAASAAKLAEVRIDRKVAALRIVEALRMHAAKEGSLPNSLDEIKLVPIPVDPVNGAPFWYTRDGDTATITGPPPRPNQPFTYRITLKK